MSAVLELTLKIPRDEIAIAADDSVTLPYAKRQRSRQRLRLDLGGEARLVLPPRTRLESGDHVCSGGGFRVLVRAAPEELSQARTADTHLLARACYHLGNRHVALEVGPGWVQYEPDHVLDEMVGRLGLTVEAVSAPFSPERGAYHDHGHAADHRHGGGSAPTASAGPRQESEAPAAPEAVR